MDLHKSQIFFFLLLSFLFGVTISSFLNIHQYFWYGSIIFGLVGVMIFWRRNWQYAFYFFLLLFFIFGSLRYQAFKINHGILNEFADKNFSITLNGYIDTEAERSSSGQRFIFRAKEIKLPNTKSKIDEKVLINTPPYPQYLYGQELKMEGRLKNPHNFEDFDYKSYLAKDQVFTIMSLPYIEDSDVKLSFTEKLKISFFEKIFLVKNKFENSIKNSISEPEAAFINGILLGSRESIPKDIKDNFAKTSTSHILAISGYNITIIAIVVSWILLLFLSRRISFWFSIGSILIFALLTGASASVMRAAVMGLLVLLAQNSGRLYDSKNALILAATAMIWFNPMSLRFDIGFQLSFLATIGILFVVPILKPYAEKLPKLFNFRETLLMTLSAQLMVLPLLLFYFHNFSLVSLPTNLIVLPFVPYAMLLGFLSGIAGMIWINLGIIIGWLASLISAFEISVVGFFANIPYSNFNIPIPWYGVIILYGLIFYILKKIKSGSK